MSEQVPVAEFVDRIRSLADGRRRSIVGICGPPGSGKSTLAAQISSQLDATVVPMDGFHLPNHVLDAGGLRSVKGSPQTFDAAGFVDAVRAIRRGEPDLSLPAFDRDIDDPVPGAINVAATAHVVLVEGNYLLLDEHPWAELRGLFDLVAYVHIDDEVRVARLIDRHVEFGRSANEAREFVLRSDEVNASLVVASRGAADVVVLSD